MTAEKFSASIVIPTYNGETYLRQLLEMIRKQKLQPLEILAFDSESSDSTCDILSEYKIPITTVERKKFSHPGTRNWAAKFCSGKYVVFLTQDAVPSDSCWLECLLRPFQDFPKVAGSFSRQIPRPGANLLEANDLRMGFPRERFVKKFEDGKIADKKRIWKMIHFSNSSSAYDRELLLQNPFEETLSMVEDQEWCWRMLNKNYTLVYEPASVVLHSHEHTWRQKYARNAAMGQAFSSFLQPVMGTRSWLWELGAWAAHVSADVSYILRADATLLKKCKSIVLSPLHRASMHYGYLRGWNSRLKSLKVTQM